MYIRLHWLKKDKVFFDLEGYQNNTKTTYFKIFTTNVCNRIFNFKIVNWWIFIDQYVIWRILNCQCETWEFHTTSWSTNIHWITDLKLWHHNIYTINKISRSKQSGTLLATDQDNVLFEKKKTKKKKQQKNKHNILVSQQKYTNSLCKRILL